MPYTPPSQQSSAASKSDSPNLSRASSYSEHNALRSPMTSRPQLPRSHSSSSYLHKHRRAPSFQKSEAPPTPTEVTEANQSGRKSATENSVEAKDFGDAHGSLRQSPPPVNNLVIPTGAVISPPDSSENSGDEDNAKRRGRELTQKWEQLEEAVRGIHLKRESSPEKPRPRGHQAADSEPVSQSTSPTALTPEARKISHSRSSTEGMVPRQPSFTESPTQTSSSDDSDEDTPKPPALVRKKSGELVKPALRPSSRRRYSSMPGTPTYSKSVHFNDSDNQTRHFLQVDKPMAVSAGSSPVEQHDSEPEFPFVEKTEREIRLANFPPDSHDRSYRPVRVESITLSDDKQTLIGTVAVHNIAYHKHLVARFTFDYWKTTSEVVAEFQVGGNPERCDGCDRFKFHIKLSDAANVDDKTLLICVRYHVSWQEFWDNNDGQNYSVDFTKTVKQVKPVVSPGLGARPLNAIPRSRHSPTSTRGRQESVDDDFISRFDPSSAYGFGSASNLLDDSHASIKLKPRTKRGSVFPGGPAQPQTNGLGGRYDFGASLTAALTSAQNKLGKHSGLMGERAVNPRAQVGYFGVQERTQGPEKPATPQERPDSLTTERPAMGSDQYRDLVQKFCYFTPSATGRPANSPSAQPPKSQAAATSSLGAPPAAASAGAVREQGSVSSSTSSTSTSSGTSTPTYHGKQQLDGVSERFSPALSPFINSRSGSPSPVTGQGYGARASSPVNFGYPYHSRDNGYLSDSPLPTAIQG